MPIKIMNVNEKIILLLELQKKSIRNLANCLGIYPSSVCAWKQGSYPSAKYIKKIAEFFDVSIEYLFNDEVPLKIDDIPLKSNICESDTITSNKKQTFTINDSSNDAFQNSNFTLEALQNSNALSTNDEITNVYNALDPRGKHKILALAYEELDRMAQKNSVS